MLKKPEQATANIANNSAHARIAKLDNAKFLLIMSVVIGHFCDYYAKYSSFLDSVRILRLFFEMPAFIFISGLFCKKLYSKYSSAQPGNAIPFHKILPYFNLFLVTHLLVYVTIRLTRNPNFPLTLFTFNSVGWFGFAIFIFYIAMWMLRDIDTKYTMFFALLLACFEGYDKNMDNFLCLSRMFLLFPFFLAGYAAPYEKLIAFWERKELKLFGAAFLIFMIYMVFSHLATFKKFILFLCWQYPFAAAGAAAAAYIKPLPWALVRAAHLAVVTLTCLSFFSIVPPMPLFFTQLGRRTAAIYALHMPLRHLYIYSGVNNYLKSTFGDYWDVVFLLVPIAVTFLLSAKCFSKIFEPLLNPKLIK